MSIHKTCIAGLFRYNPGMFERKEAPLRKKWGQYIAGIDEAGRGPWAGPVSAACVVLPENLKLKGLNDSKKLTEEQREYLYKIIMAKAMVGFAFSSEKIIDKYGIKKANYIAMQKAIAKLPIAPNFLLIDGRDNYKFDIPSEFLIKGDQRVRCIAAASIVAKVRRDHYMLKMAKKYPQYSFESHKGYGTRKHQMLLNKYGICAIHRRSFKPIAALVD